MSTLDHPANPNVPLEEMMRRIELAVRIRPEFGNTREFYVTLHRADVREYWRAHPQALEAVIDSLFMEEDALWGPIEILADPDWIGVKTPLWKKIALRAAKDLEVAVRKESDYGRKTHFEKWRALLEAHPELKEFYAEIAPGVDPADTDGAGAQRLAAIAARITGNPCPALLKPVPPLE